MWVAEYDLKLTQVTRGKRACAINTTQQLSKRNGTYSLFILCVPIDPLEYVRAVCLTPEVVQTQSSFQCWRYHQTHPILIPFEMSTSGVWSFGYGANMDMVALQNKKKVKVLEHCPAILRGFRLAFSMRGPPYGSVSAGREKWPCNVLFFFKKK